MNSWFNPEVFAGIFLTFSAIALALKKLGWINLQPRNNVKLNGTSKGDCDKRHDKIERSIERISRTQQGNVAAIKHNTEKLKDGMDRFKEIENRVTTIDTNVAVIRERIGQQHEHTLSTMNLILKKLSD
jgi:succinate dehydrogenase/fumarate reductase flavoprotein subunit